MADALPFRLPDLGEGMAEAEVVRWEVEVGDHVSRDQIVVHVQTDKAEVELPVPFAGTIASLGGHVGDILSVGATLLELVPDDAGARPEIKPASIDLGIRGEVTQVRSPGRPGAQAAPPVRKLARELAVDLAELAGSGPGGRVTANDVRAAAAAAAVVVGETRVPLRGIRRAMARNMAEAWRTVPHISLFDEIDARPLLDALREAREQPGAASLTLTAFFVRASVVALTAQPIMNASLDEATDEIVYHDSIHVGVAVASSEGLVVPVVHDAQTLTLSAVGNDISRLTGVARAGGLPPEEVRGATFTVTNYGTEGGRFATPIVRPPQVAILGCGAVRPQPVVDGDHVVVAPALPLSLSADHRVIDGHDATKFLDSMARFLREPRQLLDG